MAPVASAVARVAAACWERAAAAAAAAVALQLARQLARWAESLAGEQVALEVMVEEAAAVAETVAAVREVEVVEELAVLERAKAPLVMAARATVAAAGKAVDLEVGVKATEAVATGVVETGVARKEAAAREVVGREAAVQVVGE